MRWPRSSPIGAVPKKLPVDGDRAAPLGSRFDEEVVPLRVVVGHRPGQGVQSIDKGSAAAISPAIDSRAEAGSRSRTSGWFQQPSWAIACSVPRTRAVPTQPRNHLRADHGSDSTSSTIARPCAANAPQSYAEAASSANDQWGRGDGPSSSSSQSHAVESSTSAVPQHRTGRNGQVNRSTRSERRATTSRRQ